PRRRDRLPLLLAAHLSRARDGGAARRPCRALERALRGRALRPFERRCRGARPFRPRLRASRQPPARDRAAGRAPARAGAAAHGVMKNAPRLALALCTAAFFAASAQAPGIKRTIL